MPFDLKKLGKLFCIFNRFIFVEKPGIRYLDSSGDMTAAGFSVQLPAVILFIGSGIDDGEISVVSSGIEPRFVHDNGCIDAGGEDRGRQRVDSGLRCPPVGGPFIPAAVQNMHVRAPEVFKHPEYASGSAPGIYRVVINNVHLVAGETGRAQKRFKLINRKKIHVRRGGIVLPSEVDCAGYVRGSIAVWGSGVEDHQLRLAGFFLQIVGGDQQVY